MRRQPSYTLPLLLILFGMLVALFSPILFTTKIVRAPDILNEFYWGVNNAFGKPLWSMLRIDLSNAGWDPYINSGHTNDGGMASMQFHLYQRLLFGLIPAPASVAWFMVLHLFLGGAGSYLYCRLIGCSKTASFLAALVFSFCTENVSLINAGHVMKIATIAHAPWVFYFLEKGFRSRRWFPYLCAGMVLAFQFFNTHWQIAYYTCLAVAVYTIIRLLYGFFDGETILENSRTLLMTVVMTTFFLSASAISLAPLAGWSKDTNRGVHSGANQGKGGLEREEAMSWSLPPEEALALLIPGLFGLSRQEGGDKPNPEQTYYWGRMIFTQTASYFGLLPWMLLPLPLFFRKDRITTAALVAVIVGILFSMGKYTPFYQFLYDYLPGISRFRVPKMMLFMTAFGLAVLTARAVDILRDDKIMESGNIKRWFYWIIAFPFFLTLMLAVEKLYGSSIRGALFDLLSRPTRYQSGLELVSQRWFNIEKETGIALALASFYALLLLGIARRNIRIWLGIPILLFMFTADLWRVNRQFLVLTEPPNRTEASLTAAMKWIKMQGQGARGKGHELPEYRVLPLGDSDPMRYASARIPVLFTANAVQKVRWQNYLDALSLDSSMLDIMNVRWLVSDEKVYEREKGRFGERYLPVFRGGGEVVLENSKVLPKVWLVSDLRVVTDPAERFKLMQGKGFEPSKNALIESAPSKPLAKAVECGKAELKQYDAEKIVVKADLTSSCMLLIGEKYHSGWKATVDNQPLKIVPVNHILRGVYLEPGRHLVEFRFDPLPFKIGKWLTLGTLTLFGLITLREWWFWRRSSDAS